MHRGPYRSSSHARLDLVKAIAIECENTQLTRLEIVVVSGLEIDRARPQMADMVWDTQPGLHLLLGEAGIEICCIRRIPLLKCESGSASVELHGAAAIL